MEATEELTPRQACERRIQALESIAYDLERAFRHLEDEIETLREQYPPLRGVMECEVRGWAWYTDGHRAIRGAWPGDYEPRDHNPDLGRLIADWEKVTTRVTLATIEQAPERDPVAVLSDGIRINANWLRELLHGRGYSMHHEPGPGAVVFRDLAGDVAAAVMPVSF